MMEESLWGEEFAIPEKEKTKKIIDKIKKPKESTASTEKVVKSKKISLEDKLQVVKADVYKILGKQIDNVLVIRDIKSLHEYLGKALNHGRIAVDTETNNSLDPITCKLMGLCLYIEGEKQVYAPVNHINRETKEKLPDQLSESDIKSELDWLVNQDKCNFIFHNGKFDYQVIKCTCGCELPINWDTMIGAKLLDENEKAGLKEQYISKIDPEQEKYSIDHLFQKLPYEIIDPDLFALYAATDAMMTDKLYLWQMDKFKDPSLHKVLDLANNLEMPLVKVIAEMELKGMEVDQEYAKLLSKKYHKLLDNIDAQIDIELTKLKPQIDAWRLTPEANEKQKSARSETLGKSKAEQLEDPINLGSPTQLAILFYDILKCTQVSKKSPRGTGENELKAIAEKLKLKFCDLLLDRRELVKLITTYIDVIPETAKIWPDGRIRTHFNQYGADTGRLSSGGRIAYVDKEGNQKEIGGVNFQNIPSHNKEIRMLFCSKPGYKIIGGDFSAQEPRITTHMSQDKAMLDAYRQGKDLYAVIASMSFDKPYEECLEFNPITKKKSVEGAERRSQAKSILLGLEYGRGAASIGEQIHKTKEEAQEIINKFFKAFPSVKKWIDQSIADAHKYGYVEDIAGRRRRLPDILLPKYEVKDLNEKGNSTFNPFLICEDRTSVSSLVETYYKKLMKVNSRKDYEKIQQEALKQGVEIHDNTGFIAQAERQAVNSRIQGGAASLTKKALLDIYNDKYLRDMGAYLVNTVHDEILIEAPDEHMKECAARLCQLMIESAKKYVPDVPMSVDPYITNCWYLDEFNALVKKEFKNLLEKDHMDPMDAFEYMCDYRSESTRDQIYELVGEFLPRIPENVKIIHTLTE